MRGRGRISQPSSPGLTRWSTSYFLSLETKTWMAGHRRAEATPSFGRLCPAMASGKRGWCVELCCSSAVEPHRGGVGAADQYAHALSGRRPVTLREQRREGRRASGLCHDAQSRPQRLLRLTDVVIGDQHHLSDV